MERVFQALAGIWLLAVVFIGVGGTWLQHNEEEVAIAALGAAANYDPDASTLDQAKNIADGYANGQAILADAKRGWAESRQAEIDRTYASDDWGDGSASDLGDEGFGSGID